MSGTRSDGAGRSSPGPRPSRPLWLSAAGACGVRVVRSLCERMPQTARGASGPLWGGFRPAAICASSPSGSVTASSPQTAGSGSPSGVNPSSASAASSSTQSRTNRAAAAWSPPDSAAAASGNSANSSGRSPRSAATAPQTSSDLRWRTRVHLSRATSMAAAKERAGSERHRRKTARASTTHASRSSSAAVGMAGPPAGHLALMKLCTETWPESRPGVEFFSVFRPGAAGGPLANPERRRGSGHRCQIR